MEPQHFPQQQPQQQQQQLINEDSSCTSKTSILCRQSSTRWIPTSDQIRILKDLYYNNGVRSPSAEQIQRISSILRQYGKIEGKNVFYWFQNHKARERQKKKFTVDVTPMQRGFKPQDSIPTNYTNMPTDCFTGFCQSSTSSPGVVAAGQTGNCGSLLMEKSFRECTISGGGYVGSSKGWIGVESCGYKRRSIENSERDRVNNVETLPLFPMHAQEDATDDTDHDNNNINNDLFTLQKQLDDNSNDCLSKWPCFQEQELSGTSLELSLSSYSAGPTQCTWTPR